MKKIREDAYYRTRGGDVVGPMRYAEPGSDFPWITLTRCWTIEGMVFRELEGAENCMDLISEVYVSDMPPADAPAPETKTLRDEFAMVAIASCAVGPQTYRDAEFPETAAAAYVFADMMMDARKK
jgi:hypothetical protein